MSVCVYISMYVCVCGRVCVCVVPHVCWCLWCLGVCMVVYMRVRLCASVHILYTVPRVCWCRWRGRACCSGRLRRQLASGSQPTSPPPRSGTQSPPCRSRTQTCKQGGKYFNKCVTQKLFHQPTMRPNPHRTREATQAQI